MARNVHRKLIEKKLVSNLKTYRYYLRCTCGWAMDGPFGSRSKAVERWKQHRGNHADETLAEARKRLLAMQEDKDRCPCDNCKRMFAQIMAEQTYLQDVEKQKAAWAAAKMEEEIAIENWAAEIHRDAEQARDRVAEIVAKFTQRDVAQG